MKQGSILSYLQRATAAPAGKDESSQHQPSAVLDLISNEKTAMHVTESQDIEIESDIQADDMKNDARRTIAYRTRLRDPRASVTRVFPSHVERLKSITSTLLPVRYSDRFFAECLESDNTSVLSYTSLFDSKPVGWIRCRIEPFTSPESTAYQQIYIQALGVLAPYRGIGLGSALLEAIVSDRSNARSIYAHVWETNEDALEWYDKHGFQRILLVPQYYRKLKPSGAWIVRRDLT